MKIMLIAATALSVLPLLLSLLMPNWYLGDQQNAVEDPDLVERRASIALSRRVRAVSEGIAIRGWKSRDVGVAC